MFNAIEVHGVEALLEQLRDELSGRARSLAHDDPGEIQTSRSASRRLPPKYYEPARAKAAQPRQPVAWVVASVREGSRVPVRAGDR